MGAPLSETLEIDETAWPIIVWKFRALAASPVAQAYLTRAATQAERAAPHAYLLDARGLECPSHEERRRLMAFVSGHQDHLQKRVSAIAVVSEQPAFRFALSTVVLALPWLPPTAVHSKLGLAEAWCQRRLALQEQRRLSTIPARSRDPRGY